MSTHPVATGILQGSPLSPILYLFYNAHLIDELHAAAAGKALVTGYIDDICILVWSKSARDNYELLERLHQVADAWASRHASRFVSGLIHMWNKGWRATRVSRPPSGESITPRG